VGAALVAASAITTYFVMRPGDLDVELHLLEGTVDSVNADGAHVCLVDLECFQATNLLDPIPQVGDWVRIVYGPMPIDPELGAKTNKLVAIEILPRN